MSTHVVCPSCGARNAAGAPWCGQCYRPLTPEDEEAGSDIQTTEDGAAQLSLHLTPQDQPRVGRDSWVCTTCGTTNPLVQSACSACGATIFDRFKEDSVEPRDPRRALIRGLLVPGLGHFYSGQSILGVSAGALAIFGIVFGIVLMTGGVMLAGLLLLLMGLGVWMMGALDAYRWARGEPNEVVLRPRVLSVIMAVMLLVLIAVAVGTRGKT